MQDGVRGVRSRCLADSVSSTSAGASAAAEALGRASDAAAALPLLNSAGAAVCAKVAAHILSLSLSFSLSTLSSSSTDSHITLFSFPCQASCTPLE